MKITDIELNDYGRKFISIDIEPNEVCKTEPYISATSYNFFPVAPDGETYHIEINRHHFNTGLTGQTIGYGNTWAVGCGSGAVMGWSLGHDLETAINACKAFCNVIENNTLVARIYLNMPDNMEAYTNDSPKPLIEILKLESY